MYKCNDGQIGRTWEITQVYGQFDCLSIRAFGLFIDRLTFPVGSSFIEYAPSGVNTELDEENGMIRIIMS